VVHGKPVSGYLAVKVAISDGGALQLRPDGFDTAVCHVVLDGRVDESAALAGFSHPVDGLDGGFRQNDVDAFAHGTEVNDLIKHSIYTNSVYVKLNQWVVSSLRGNAGRSQHHFWVEHG
jgi:hypothetical protein